MVCSLLALPSFSCSVLRTLFTAGLLLGTGRIRSSSDKCGWISVRIGGPNVGLTDYHNVMKYYFMTMHWLKNYLAGRFQLDDRDVREWLEFFVNKLFLLGYWATNGQDWPQTNDAIIGIVDGTHCPVMKPSHPVFPFDAVYKSPKLGKDALWYEVLLDMNGCPIHINGPFPAGTPDNVIFKDKLEHMVPDGKLVLADKGYRGLDQCCTQRVR